MRPEHNSSIKRRQLLRASGIGLTSALLAGCAGDGGDGGGDGGTSDGGSQGTTAGGGTTQGQGGGGSNTVHVLTDFATDQWKEFWSKTTKSFAEDTEYGVNLEYTGISTGGLQRLGTLIQSGAPPEVYYGGVSLSSQFALQGNFANMSDLFDRSYTADKLGEFYASTTHLNPPKMDGPWQLPMTTYLSHPIVYRKDVYDELGLSVPETWSELLENAKTIDESDMDIRGFAMGGGTKGGASFQALLRSNNAAQFKWASEDREEAEVWLPKEKTVETLEFELELAKYGPDPSGLSWGTSFNQYAAGRFAHVFDINAWHTQIAAGAGNDKVVNGSDVMLCPRNDGVEPLDRGFIQTVGPQPLNTDNTEGGKAWIEYAHGTPEKLAEGLTFSPMQLLPVTKKVYETDVYTSADIFQKYPHLLEINKKESNELAPHYAHPERAVTGPSMYANSLGYSDQWNQELWSSGDAEKVYNTMVPLYEDSLKKGKDLLK